MLPVITYSSAGKVSSWIICTSMHINIELYDNTSSAYVHSMNHLDTSSYSHMSSPVIGVATLATRYKLKKKSTFYICLVKYCFITCLL